MPKYLAPINLTFNELQNATIQNLSSDPSGAYTGGLYYNTSVNRLKLNIGTISSPVWTPLSTSSDSGLAFNAISDGTNTGLSSNSQTITFASANNILSAIVSSDTLTLTVNQGNITHNSIGGLTSGDPHTQYLYLAGRSGGQTAYGGTANTDNLVLKATSNGTNSGTVQINTALGVSTSVVSVTDGVNFSLGTGTGTQFGTSSSQKIGFFGATPVARQSGDIGTALVNLGLMSSTTGFSTTNLTTTNLTINTGGSITIGDGDNIAVGTSTGTQIGTSSSQKIAFFGNTPITQQLVTNDLLSSLVTVGIIGGSGATPLNLNGGTLQSARYYLGTDLGLFPVSGGASTVQTYWTLQLAGLTENVPQNFTSSNFHGNNSAHVIAYGSQASIPVIWVSGAASQTAHLQDWTNNSGTVLASVSSTGAITAPYFIGDGSQLTNLPAGSGNYIQNQNASAQTANFWINGSGMFGSNVVASSVLTTNISVNGGHTNITTDGDGGVNIIDYGNYTLTWNGWDKNGLMLNGASLNLNDGSGSGGLGAAVNLDGGSINLGSGGSIQDDGSGGFILQDSNGDTVTFNNSTVTIQGFGSSYGVLNTNGGIVNAGFVEGLSGLSFSSGGTLVDDGSGGVNIEDNNGNICNFFSGVLSAGAFSGSGSGLTSLNASNISSGTVPTARLGSGTASSSTYLRGDNTWATVSGGSGTVTSVALTAPSFLSVSGSPVTTTGTLALTLATQSANLVFAGPSSGSAASPTFRSLAAADIPGTLNATAFSSTVNVTGQTTVNAFSTGTFHMNSTYATSGGDTNQNFDITYDTNFGSGGYTFGIGYLGTTLNAGFKCANVTGGTGTIFFFTNQTERMRINQSGNMLVGTTTDNGSLFTVNGKSATISATVGTGYVGSSPPSNGMIIQGNVGVGTSSVTYPLTVSGAASISGVTYVSQLDFGSSTGTKIAYFGGVGGTSKYGMEIQSGEWRSYCGTTGTYFTYGVYNSSAFTESIRMTVGSTPSFNIGVTSGTGIINIVSGTTNTSGIYFGSDTNLYRSAAGVLKTDVSLAVVGRITSGLTTASGTTQTIDVSVCNDINFTATANTTLTLSNGVDHQMVRIRFIQGGSGGYSLTIANANFGSSPTDLSACTQSTAGQFAYVGLVYNAAKTKWDVIATEGGFS